MYPDEEHFWNENDYQEFHCPNRHEKKFMECLEKNEVETNDTKLPGYIDCMKKKEQWYEKCNAENGTDNILKRHLKRTRPYKCDKFNVVYSLTKNESNFLKPYDECNRPFVVQRIAHSNLILLITNRVCAQVFATEQDFEEVPKTIEYENSTFCHRQKKPLYRSRPKSCMTHHNDVRKIFKYHLSSILIILLNQEPIFDKTNKDRAQCGRGHKLKLQNLTLAFSLISAMLKLFSSK
jgi:hypothetical protein